MRCAIMQPTYMPWAGYLNLMTQVDVFVYLDDAQYERSSWQNRNRVLVKGAPTWMTVPVQRGFLGAKIHQVQVDDRMPWRRKHAAMLTNAYARHPHASDLVAVTEHLTADASSSLADVNISLLDLWRTRLGIQTPLLRSSQMGVEGVRTQRLISLLGQLGATEYVTPPGALGYLQEDQFTRHTTIKLLVHDFQPAPYPQRDTTSFVSHLSMLDVLAHLGWAGLSSYIRPPRACIQAFEDPDDSQP